MIYGRYGMKFTNKKKGIRYGDVNLPDSTFAAQNVKLKVTAYLDLDIIRALKTEAQNSGTKYQTLMNQKLREMLFGATVNSKLKDEIIDIVRSELKKMAS